MKIKKSSNIAILFAFSTLLFAILPSISYGDDHIPADRILRLKKVEGAVWFKEVNGKEYEEAYENIPVFEGMRLITDFDSRACLESSWDNLICLDEETESIVTRISDNSVTVRLVQGTLLVSHRGGMSSFETVVKMGVYGSVALVGRGKLKVEKIKGSIPKVKVKKGKAILKTGGKKLLITEGEEAVVRLGSVALNRVYEADPFDSYADEVEREQGEHDEENIYEEEDSHDIPPKRVYRELSLYGEWIEVPSYGRVWRPRIYVEAWAPFTYGRWVFISPAGWVWVSFEPWGWVTYHYGYWAKVRGTGWVWVPGRDFRKWYPARVRFRITRRKVIWVPARPGEKVVVIRKRNPIKRFSIIINKRVVRARPVIVREKRVYVVRDFKPFEKWKRHNRRHIYYNRRDGDNDRGYKRKNLRRLRPTEHPNH